MFGVRNTVLAGDCEGIEMKLDGKVALVTGAGSGIGRATAARFVREGAKVVASDLAEAGLASLAQELQAAGHNTLTTIRGDVSAREDAEKMVEAAVDTYGGIDILVNNAGIMDGFSTVAEMDDALFSRVLGVNLWGPMFTMRKALSYMLPAGAGSIVNIASVAGLNGARGGAAYTSSKHAVVGLSKSLAFQYAQKGIRCNVVCPGPVATNISVNNPNMFGLERSQVTFASIVRQGQPDELASAILFLASDEASFVNGEVLVVDGGWTAG